MAESLCGRSRWRRGHGAVHPAGVPAGSVHRAIRSAQEFVFESGDPAVLDQLSDPPLRLDVPAARYRFDQHRASVAGTDPRSRFRCSITMERCCWDWSTAFCRSPCCRFTPPSNVSIKSLLEAAADLGARPIAVLTRVTLPLCAPGIGAAAILVFVPCLGTYITSDLLGGSKTILIGNLVQNQFTTARDWPFGAAVSIVLMIVAVAADVRRAAAGRGTSMKRGLARLRHRHLCVSASAVVDPGDLQRQCIALHCLAGIFAALVWSDVRRSRSFGIGRE